jgi:hypothetical protein
VTQVLAIEEVLLAQPEMPPNVPENKKDRPLAEQARNICELVKVTRITSTMEANGFGTRNTNGIGAQNGAMERNRNGEGNGKRMLVYCNVP